MPERLDVWTDGACINNGKKGCVAGIGVYFGDGNSMNMSELLPFKMHSNQKAEIYAIIRALEKIDEEIIDYDDELNEIYIYTDSKYVINSINDWIYRWMKNGWLKVDGSKVKNRKLLLMLYNKIIYFEDMGISVILVYVRGHSGNYGNEFADRLAKQEIQKRSYPTSFIS